MSDTSTKAGEDGGGGGGGGASSFVREKPQQQPIVKQQPPDFDDADEQIVPREAIPAAAAAADTAGAAASMAQRADDDGEESSSDEPAPTGVYTPPSKRLPSADSGAKQGPKDARNRGPITLSRSVMDSVAHEVKKQSNSERWVGGWERVHLVLCSEIGRG